MSILLHPLVAPSTFDMDLGIFDKLLSHSSACVPHKRPRIHSHSPSHATGTVVRSETADDDDAWRARLEVPGVPRDNISVTIDNGVLKVTGTHRRAFGAKARGGAREESASTFSHSYRLPRTGYDEARITAALTDGLLDITVPKVKRPPPRSIAVDIATAGAAKDPDPLRSAAPAADAAATATVGADAGTAAVPSASGNVGVPHDKEQAVNASSDAMDTDAQ